MLNIPNLAAQWGKIAGGVNVFSTFSGTTAPARADTIAALYTNAAQQRLATGGLYDQMQSVAKVLAPTTTYFFNLAKDTLKVAALEDSAYPIATDDLSLLTKLINDAVAQAQTFQLPTVTIGGAATATGTGVTTLLGAPHGNGVAVGTVIDPSTGVVRYYSFVETIQIVCNRDSYVDGAIAGQETFALNTFSSVPANDPTWPKGSGVQGTLQSAPSSLSTMIGNAYFDNWSTSVANTPLTWTINNLVPGTTLFQTTDAYSSTYAVKFTAAPINAELIQPITGLTGNQNYIAAIRMKRATNITGGVITVAVRDSSGTIIQTALGADLSFTVPLTGASGAYTLTYALFSVPRGFATPNYLSIKMTTAMNAAESVEIDNVEFLPMKSVYVGGPDLVLIPGNVPWSHNDTYTFAVANSATTASFVKWFDRLYNTRVRAINLPVAGIPTISDALIS